MPARRLKGFYFLQVGEKEQASEGPHGSMVQAALQGVPQVMRDRPPTTSPIRLASSESRVSRFRNSFFKLFFILSPFNKWTASLHQERSPVAYTLRMTDASDADYETLRHGAGLADRSACGRLVLTGADRQRFLNGQVTCDVKALTPGTGAYGFFTSPQGRILADVSVLLHGEEIWLELPPGREEAIAAQLQKYIIVDRVEVRPLAGYRVLTLLGSLAAEVLRTWTPELPKSPWSHLSLPGFGEGGEPVTLVRQDGLGVEAWSLWAPAAATEALAARLLGVSGGSHVRPVAPEALEMVRAEAGIPLYGQDFGAENFPQESGLEERAVSYTKGCYLGQEVVARIHFRGGVHKGLAGLVFPAGDAVPAVGTKLVFEEKEVGTLTTAIASPALGRPIGLAILHERAAAVGTRMELAVEAKKGESGGPAEVHSLPFVPAA